MNIGRIARVASMGEKVTAHTRRLTSMSELEPRSRGMGVKSWAKYLRRYGCPNVRIRNPAKYLNRGKSSHE